MKKYGESVLIKCVHCDREFHQQDSYQDHLLSKHTGVHLDIKPSWCVEVLNSVNNEGNGGNDGNLVIPGVVVDPHLHTHQSIESETTVTADIKVEEQVEVEANVEEANVETYNCPICELHVISMEMLEEHMNGGINPNNYAKSLGKTIQDLTYICTNCNRSCRDERSLKQHYNFCISKKLVITALPSRNASTRISK